MREFWPAIGFSTFVVLLGLSAAVAAPERGEMAVIFPPFTAETAAWSAIRTAGASIVAPTQFSNIVVVQAADAGFQQRARDLGALFFIKAAGLCGSILSGKAS